MLSLEIFVLPGVKAESDKIADEVHILMIIYSGFLCILLFVFLN